MHLSSAIYVLLITIVTCNAGSDPPPSCEDASIKSLSCSGETLTATLTGITQCPATTDSLCLADYQIPIGVVQNGYSCSVAGGEVTITANLDNLPAVACENVQNAGVSASADVCALGATCPANRRRLTVSNSYKEHEDEFDQLKDTCGNFDYEGSLFVTDHIFAIATPGEEARAAGCPYLVTHAVFIENEDVAQKEVYVWKTGVAKETLFPANDSHCMGTAFKLSDILRAIQEVDPSQVNSAGYDIVKNNCANYVLNLANKLDVKVDSKVTSYVTRRLVENAGANLLEKIRDSVNFSSIGGRKLRGLPDEKVIEMLVEQSAGKQ